ncbi:DUF5672 family protein [Olivibacter sp. XZL3]|uniref:DUF5672 family protein n=1 Tax=Olivibacter sp. XZL3 TaxID=1735116 RepID=UPI00106631A4|nr:DUF5672 family protein [Olivibacter sp. XZL3]
MKERLVAVVIPFYKETLTDYEKMSMDQCVSVLSAYPIISIRPKRLNKINLSYPIDEYIDFDDNYFESIEGYNRLMLSDSFYQVFLSKFKYILIYQLDAFVFKDDLAFWCKKGYDYIGAPWPPEVGYPDIIKSAKESVINWYYTLFNVQDKHNNPHRRQVINRVGNGGFSLRNVRVLHKIASQRKKEISKYLQNDHDLYNEDIFWSVEVNRRSNHIKIPSARIARKFSIEHFPERLLRANKFVLPFGCHAWDKHIDFWRPIFEDYGYTI